MGGALVLQAHDATAPKVTESESSAPHYESSIRLRLVDADTGEALNGSVRIRQKGKEKWLDLSAQLLNRGHGLKNEIRALGWHAMVGEMEIRVPDGPIEIEAFSGLEFTCEVVSASANEDAIDVPLKRIFDAGESGWIAGNTHLHLRQMTRELADRYLVEISRADDLELVFVSYLERALVDREYTTNAYTKEDLKRISKPNLLFGDGEEYRHNFGGGGEGYGHVMLLNLAERILPASVGPGITKGGTDGTALQPGIQSARDGGATVIWCHNLFGMEDLPNWLEGNVHAQNIFDGGNRGSYEDTFYRYLNIGLPAPFSTGTDWFMYDFSRVYVRTDSHSIESWLDALQKSRSVITNGPWIELTVDDAEIGDTIDFNEASLVNIKAKAVGRHEFDALEIVLNGNVIEDASSGEIETQIRLDEPAWIAARIRPKEGVVNELNQPIFGHTSAVYITFNGKKIFRTDVADGICAEIEESMKRIAAEGQFANDEEKDRVLEIYKRALNHL